MLSDFGSIASLVGLALTIWVAFTVRRIKAHFLVTARVPDLARRLREHSKKVSEFLNDPEAYQIQILEELALAEVTTHSLQATLSGRPRRMVKALLEGVRKASQCNAPQPELRNLYVQMVRVNEQLCDLKKDLKWER